MMDDPEILPQYPLNGESVYLLDDHEVVRRGLRQLLESHCLSISGESGSAREATRRIPALRPDLVILDNDLPDGSGAVCRAVAVADPSIRCLLMTGEADEAVLIESILAGAWGCLSKQDDGSEQLRLIHRALRGHTAYSGRFRAVLLGPNRPNESFLTLTRQEMNAVIRLGSGLSNRQISREMSLAERTVKKLVSSVRMKLGVEGRTQAAVLAAAALRESENPASGGYRFTLFPELVAEVTATLLECTSEAGTLPPTADVRAGCASRLADALAATRTGLTVSSPLPGWTQDPGTLATRGPVSSWEPLGHKSLGR